MTRLFLLSLLSLLHANSHLHNIPIAFEPDPSSPYPFRSHHLGPGLQLSPTEALLHLDGRSVSMRLTGANPAAPIVGDTPLPGRSNYLTGADPQLWRTNVPHFARVLARNVYPGIDVVYYGHRREFEFDFLVHPHADPTRIRIRFHNARPSLSPNGDLLLNDTLRLRRPVLYQQTPAGRRPVDGRFQLSPAGELSFSIGAYDRSHLLTIDPVLAFSTLLSASNAAGAGIAVDRSGNSYLTGTTTSGFLTVNALQPILRSGRSAFVAKFNASGNVLLYATYLTGTATDSASPPSTAGYRITVDSTGSPYLIGVTNTNNFPVSAGTVQPVNRGGDDYFITKLNPAGTAPVYSTYLGGSANENPTGGLPAIAVDSAGHAYIAGSTASRDFRVTPGALQSAHAGGDSDVIAAKIDPLGSTLVYSTFLGSSGSEAANGIAVDSAGNAHIAGLTSSPAFPRSAAAPQPAYGGGASDAFAVKLNPAGSALLYATTLGGANAETAFDIALDPSGGAYLAGVTTSQNFPVSPQALQKQPGAATGGDGFVAKLNPAGTSLTYSTYLGGRSEDFVFALAVDSAGRAIVAGGTNSPDFPVTPDALQSGLGLIRRGGGRTATAGYLARLAPDASSLTYSTYFGGSANDMITALALDSAGNAHLTGYATSINFPRTAADYEPADREDFTAPFLARFDFQSRNTMSLGSVISAASYQPGLAGVVAPGQIVTLFGSGLGPETLTTLQLDANNRVDTLLNGVRVLFDGTPAPLIYVSSRQLSAVVPYSVPINGRTTVQVDYQGQRSNPLVLWVAPALVGVFTQDSSGRGPGAILNEDGSINSPSNPAARGSVIVLYGTGEGRVNPPVPDGSVTGANPSRPVLRIFALISDRATEVLYAGAAPGLVAGVLQMNIRVPESTIPGPAVPIRIGGMDGPFGVEPSEWVTVAIK